MRRTALLVALGYGLSFVVVCLAACFMPATAAAEHGCCASEEGLRAVQHDCCSITPGVTHGGTALAPSTASSFGPAPQVVPTSAPAAPFSSPVVFASPPLVLRV